MASKDANIRNKGTLPLFKEVEADVLVGSQRDAAQTDEKPSFETTTLWDYPKQSYGRVQRK
ncbi:MAG: hypothetical protein AAGB97_06965 [Dehalococcoidia bacterium]|nr:hypothetical protein [Chloroflexota bacterium]MBT9162342.1 hypothetical protein [Chloroflexota bacterium]